MKKFLYSFLLLFTLSWLHAEKINPKMKSFFLDEMELEAGYHGEEMYGLQVDQEYQLSISIKKDKKSHPQQSFISIMTHASQKGSKNKYQPHWLVQKLGIDVPADGEWHEVKASFSTHAPEGLIFRRGKYGAFNPSMFIYNKNKEGLSVSVKNIHGVPKYETYQFLGSKNQDLPQILLVGDSTMMHTYPSKVKMLDGKASVYYIPVNAGLTHGSIKKYRRWIGKKSWDIIYFNSGIHDLTRQSEKGKKGNEYPNRTSLADYEENLTIIGKFLKTQKADLIWRSITPLGPNIAGRQQSDEMTYNKSAVKIMNELDISIHHVTEKYKEPLTKQLKDGVHFNEEGNNLLAKALSDYLNEQKLLK